MDLPACDAEANWVAFQISCANVSSLDSQARALYIVALMENSWSSETAGFGSLVLAVHLEDGREGRRTYISPTFNSNCYSILNMLFIRHDGYLFTYRFVH